MEKWEVTFYGDNWKLIVSLDYPEGDLYGLIEKAKEIVSQDDCSIEIKGYHQVEEKKLEN